MTSAFAPVGTLLMQAAAGVRDTVIMRQVGADRDLLDRVSQVATTIIAVTIVTLTVIAIPVALRLRHMYHKAHALLDRLHDDMTPLVARANRITDDVGYVTRSVRADIDTVNAAVTAAHHRVQQAAALTEQRMNEFNALLAVVQDEAEQMFVSTASAVRGVREGAASFRDGGGMDLAFDSDDVADPADDIVNEEKGDGDDCSTEPSAQALPAAPRLRPRQRTQRRT